MEFFRRIFKKKIYRFISVLLLEGIYFYNYTTPEFNVYISELPFWALTVFYTWKCYNNDNLKNLTILGIVSAIGFLSHYLFIYLLLSIDLFFIYIFFIKKEKKYNVRYFFSALIFLLLILPHLIWLFNNEFITLTYGMKRTTFEDSTILNHFQYPFLFLLKQIIILTPFWIILYFSISKFKLFKLNFRDKKFVFLLFINFFPLLLVFLTSLIFGAKIKTMWITPFYLFIGIFFIYTFQSLINLKKLNLFFVSFIFFFILSPVIYSSVSITQADKRTDYPGKKIAKKVQYIWNQKYEGSIDVVLGNEWSAGNLSYHLKSRPTWKGLVTDEKLSLLSKHICIEDICIGTQ